MEALIVVSGETASLASMLRLYEGWRRTGGVKRRTARQHKLFFPVSSCFLSIMDNETGTQYYNTDSIVFKTERRYE